MDVSALIDTLLNALILICSMSNFGYACPQSVVIQSQSKQCKVGGAKTVIVYAAKMLLITTVLEIYVGINYAIWTNLETSKYYAVINYAILSQTLL